VNDIMEIHIFKQYKPMKYNEGTNAGKEVAISYCGLEIYNEEYIRFDDTTNVNCDKCIKQNKKQKKKEIENMIGNNDDLSKLKNGKTITELNTCDIDVFIDVGYDYKTERKCPVGTYQDGRKIVFRREHHNYLKPGEVWRCNVIEDRHNCIIAAPFKRTQASPIQQHNTNKQVERLPPEVATTIVKTLQDKLNILKKKQETIDKETLEPLLKSKTNLEEELEDIQQKIAENDNLIIEAKQEKTTFITEIQMYEKSIERFSNMEVRDDITIDDLAKDTGLLGIPDYWGEKTETDKLIPINIDMTEDKEEENKGELPNDKDEDGYEEQGQEEE